MDSDIFLISVALYYRALDLKLNNLMLKGHFTQITPTDLTVVHSTKEIVPTMKVVVTRTLFLKTDAAV